MFGIGSTEFLVILLVALLVLGPKSLAKVTKTVGKYVGEFRRVSTEFQRTLNAEVAEEERQEKKEAIRRQAAEAKEKFAQKKNAEQAAAKAAEQPKDQAAEKPADKAQADKGSAEDAADKGEAAKEARA